MGNFTNAQLATKIADLIAYWSTFNTEYSDWIGGVVGGGPNTDGEYPLTNWEGIETLLPCPAQLSDNVTGYVAIVDASAVAAAASAAAALVSENAADADATIATAQAVLADADRIAAEAAESGAVDAKVTAIAQAAAAVISAAAALADSVLTAADVVLTGLDVVAAAQSATDAAASAVLAATFDPANFAVKADVETIAGGWIFSGQPTFSNTVYFTGEPRLANAKYLRSVNLAATVNVNLIGLNAADGINIGHTGYDVNVVSLLTASAGFRLTSEILNAGHDLNSIADGFYNWNATNPVNSDTDFSMLWQSEAGGRTGQLSIGRTSGTEMSIAVRRAESGVFHAWNHAAMNEQNENILGDWSFAGGISLDTTGPNYFGPATGDGQQTFRGSGGAGFYWDDTDGLTDERIWRFDVFGKNLRLSTRTDALGGGNTVFQVNRGTGTAITDITFTPIVKAATSFQSLAVGVNLPPSTDNLLVDGYGIMGNRANVYVTNAFAGGKVIIGVTSQHNQDVVAEFISGAMEVNGILGGNAYGTAGAPTIVPNSANLITGMYGESSNVLAFTTGGVRRLQMYSAVANFGVPIRTTGTSLAKVAGFSDLDSNFLHIDGKEAIDGNDTYLRLNMNGDFASGIYTPFDLYFGSSGTFRMGGSTNTMKSDGTDLNINLAVRSWNWNVGANQARENTTDCWTDTTLGADNIHHYQNVKGGGRNSNSSTETGYMLIELPDGSHNNNLMHSFVVMGYAYESTGGGWAVMVSGYAYASANWANTFAQTIYGKPPFDIVRFGEATSNKYVILGTSTTNWKYPQVVLTDHLHGYSSQGLYLTNDGAFDIDITATLPTGWVQLTTWTVGGAFGWQTAGMEDGGRVTISTAAASGGVNGDIHYRY